MDRLLRRILWVVYACVFLFGYTQVQAQDDSKTQEVAGGSNTSESTNNVYYKRMTGNAAALLAVKFKEASTEELGMTTLEKILRSLHPSSRIVTDEDLALTISERVSAKVNTATQILQEMRRNLFNDSNVESFTYPCPLQSFKKSHLRDIKINSEKVTLNIPKSNYKSYIKNAVKKFNLKVKRQYFLSIKDAATDQSCGAGSGSGRTNFRKLFHRHLQPQPKSVLVLLDSARPAPARGHLAASALLRELLGLLQPRDSVGLISVGSTTPHPLYGKCQNQTSPIGLATDKNKELLMKILNNVEINQGYPNLTSAFEKAMDVLTLLNVEQNLTVVYIGRVRYLASEMNEISEVIKRTEKFLGRNVVFSAVDVQVDSDMENTLLSNDMIPPKRCKGEEMFCEEMIIRLNNTSMAGPVASQLLLRLPLSPELDDLQASAPHWEPLQRDLLLPLVLPVHPLGLLILDLYLLDLAEDVIYFNSFSRKRRAFIIDFSGNVIAHSTYPRPETIIAKPKLVDISYLEPLEQFDILVKPNMLQNSSGSVSVRNGSDVSVFTWKWVQRVYIVCVVSENSAQGGRNFLLAGGVARELQLHRMDLLPPAQAPLCRHFQQVSSIHKGTLYLSPSSFQSPFQYLFDIKNGKDVSITLMQSYMAYLKDSTRLLSNPGLKSEIRNDVGILNPMLSYFKRQHIHGAYNKYIVRRYAASVHGVMVMFPGSILESDLEPNRRPWFIRAVRNPGRLILTPPHLDVGGAGYIITVSQAPAISAESSKPTIVLSVDMTMGYLYKMLLDSLPACAEPDIKCFIMDDRGYLLSHPGLVDPTGLGPIERQHVTHKESLIANDMLNHRELVQKQHCKNYADGTIQRFYEFNTSLDTILTNIVHGEHCARYQISSIRGTNAFVGMVNSSCNLGAFCPCSVVDRLCLNCNRMEQSECECPCECSLPDEEQCLDGPPSVPVALCDVQPEKYTNRDHFFYNLATHLDSCFDFQCESYGSRSACLGVLGCEWCQVDRDGDTSLASPFCGAQAVCFGGILGGPTPYGRGSLGQVSQDDLSPAYSAVGPIAGCIVALCLILALAVYCYKQNSAVETIEPYAAPTPDAWPRSGIQMSRLSEDDIRDERSGHQDKLLLANEPVAPVSPYRILTGYRRPNTTGESDHGYSTMTPHDDSEHQAFALVEPFLSPEPAGSSPSPSLSADLPGNGIGTGTGATVLPCGKNNIIAAVTVHRHMEAT